MQFHCNLVRLQFGKKNRNVQFRCNLGTSPISWPTRPGEAILEKNRNCAISLQPGALARFSLPTRPQTQPFRRKKKELCDVSATWCTWTTSAGSCAISLAARAAVQFQRRLVRFNAFIAKCLTWQFVNCAISLPPRAQAATVQFHCRLALPAIILPKRAVCKFAAALSSCAISMPNAASVQFRCRLVPLELSIVQFLCRLGQQRRLCNFAAALRCRHQRVQSANTPPPCAVVQFQCQTWQLCNFAAALCR